MLNKANAVMSPSEKFSCIGVRTNYDTPATKVGQLAFIYNDIIGQNDKDWAYQDLYITTEEEVKEGWVLVNNSPGKDSFRWILGKIISNFDTTIEVDLGWSSTQLKLKSDCRKIVATTNPDLWYKNIGSLDEMRQRLTSSPTYPTHFSIPKIGTDFIEAFIREQGNIKEVNLEYEEISYRDICNHSSSVIVKQGLRAYCPYCSNYLDITYGYKPKLHKNGTVIIHPIKEKSYTREEFKKAVINAYNQGANWAFNKEDLYPHETINSNEWFEKKYPNH